MENASIAVQLEAVKSLQSTIRKLENALSQMTQSGANTTLVKKRLLAISIGLAVLEEIWNQKSHHYSHEALEEAHHVLIGLIPSVESSYIKSKPGSSQKTLLERRITALRLVIQALDETKSNHAAAAQKET
ncbi:hypothetical protein A7K91_20345 [Paenibacillus oryzae]|uniref:Uncharacterized protein n=1 Tax=Paenibacillus oryzae TaxID=1844972 RepID=A0A1A5YEN3_9BACL|nr:hypothetical protein [Paenibacillus oryzae]OBR64044.1 hypothetical protein A7K91_20345 [Paenibacillus oryzae]